MREKYGDITFIGPYLKSLVITRAYSTYSIKKN